VCGDRSVDVTCLCSAHRPHLFRPYPNISLMRRANTDIPPNKPRTEYRNKFCYDVLFGVLSTLFCSVFCYKCGRALRFISVLSSCLNSGLIRAHFCLLPLLIALLIWTHSHPNQFDHEHAGNMFLRNIRICCQGYSVSQPDNPNLCCFMGSIVSCQLNP
jgi:hypothetical protein